VKTTYNKKLFAVLKLCIFIFIVYMIATRLDLRKVADCFVSMNTLKLIGALWCAACALSCNVLKWQFIVKRFAHGTTRDITASYFAGFPYALATPAGIGELGRCMYLPDVDKRTGISLTLIDKMFNMLLVVLFGTGATLLLTDRLPSLLLLIGGVFAGTLLSIVALYLAAPRMLYMLALKIPMLRHKKTRPLLSVLKKTTPHDNIIIFSFSLVSYIFFCTEFVLFATAITPIPSLFALQSFMSAMLIKNLVPLSIADLGVREASLIGLFAFGGYAKEPALAASLMQYTMNVLVPAVIGTVIIAYKGGRTYGR